MSLPFSSLRSPPPYIFCRQFFIGELHDQKKAVFAVGKTPIRILVSTHNAPIVEMSTHVLQKVNYFFPGLLRHLLGREDYESTKRPQKPPVQQNSMLSNRIAYHPKVWTVATERYKPPWTKTKAREPRPR